MSSYLTTLLHVFLFIHVSPAMSIDNVSFNQNYHNTWGFNHFLSTNQGKEVQLSIDRYSGSGFRSKHGYGSGFFGMRIKLPSKDSLGIITAFYLTSDGSAGHHDELDFEFLRGYKKPYILQTNVFSNDSGGREERINLWFDPAADFHKYQILWNPHQIVFYVDSIPIRVFENNTGIGVNHPSQPMSIVGSLWSDENWATNGHKINWTQAPFVASFRGFNIDGCLQSHTTKSHCYSTKYKWNTARYIGLDSAELTAYENIRRKYLTYSYCSDRGNIHPECQEGKLE